MALLRLFLLLAVALLASFRPSVAEIRVTEVRSDGRTIIPFDEFGFTHHGVLELNVSGISLSDSTVNLDQLGFFLSTRDAWIHVLQQLQDHEITCPLESSSIENVYFLDRLNNPNPSPSGVSIPRSTSFGIVFNQSKPGQYTLVFANCLRSMRISMTVRSAMYNQDPRTEHRAYLSAGAAALPLIYFLLFLAYATLAAVWVAVLLRKRLAAFRIHYFMLAVVVLKALNLLCEAEDKSYIEQTGSAHGWDVLFYIFSFLKGISLFTLIVLTLIPFDEFGFTHNGILELNVSGTSLSDSTVNLDRFQFGFFLSTRDS